jgi:hypothetical protein
MLLHTSTPDAAAALEHSGCCCMRVLPMLLLPWSTPDAAAYEVRRPVCALRMLLVPWPVSGVPNAAPYELSDAAARALAREWSRNIQRRRSC